MGDARLRELGEGRPAARQERVVDFLGSERVERPAGRPQDDERVPAGRNTCRDDLRDRRAGAARKERQQRLALGGTRPPEPRRSGIAIPEGPPRTGEELVVVRVAAVGLDGEVAALGILAVDEVDPRRLALRRDEVCTPTPSASSSARISSRLGRPADVPNARRTAAPAARPVRIAATAPVIVARPFMTAPTVPSSTSHRPIEPNGRDTCALTTAIRAAAAASRTEGNWSAFSRPKAASPPGQCPPAARAARRPIRIASAIARTASNVILVRRVRSGATSISGGPEDEEAGQEAPDRREPVREGLEQGQQRPLERPRGLGRDEARQCDQTGGQDNDVRRPSHANLAGRRRVQRPARLPHTRRRRLALRPGRGARASLRGHLFGLERVGAGHAVSAPSLRAAKGDAPDRHSWSGQHPVRVKRRPRRRLTAERSAESTPRLHGEGSWRAAGRVPRVPQTRRAAPRRRRDRLRRAHRCDPASEWRVTGGQAKLAIVSNGPRRLAPSDYTSSLLPKCGERYSSGCWGTSSVRPPGAHLRC